MPTLEFQFKPDRFQSMHDGSRNTLRADLQTRVLPGNHVLVQEQTPTGSFTGRWIRYQVTRVNRTAARQVLTVTELGRNSTVRSISKRAA